MQHAGLINSRWERKEKKTSRSSSFTFTVASRTLTPRSIYATNPRRIGSTNNTSLPVAFHLFAFASNVIIKDTTKKRSSSDNFRRYANGALAGYYEINTNIAESVKAR